MPPCSKKRKLFLRSLSSIVLIPLIICIIYSSKMIFGLLTVIVFFMAIEWRRIINQHKSHKVEWEAMACVYICVFFLSFMQLKLLFYGNNALLWLVITVWAADTAAFAIGSLFGGPKLAPKISSSKTWAGFHGAVFHLNIDWRSICRTFSYQTQHSFYYHNCFLRNSCTVQ